MQQYTHRPPTQANSFRVLRLEPAASFDDPLRCSLIDASLSDCITYEALSYVWGAPTGNRLLICDGAELLITPNCELALRYLRPMSIARTLWVDSVCIDQKSTSDRNHQVKRMGEIYRKATQVLIWLGESDDQTKSAFALWGKLEQGNESSGRFTNDDKQYVDDLCTRSWFRRVWTIQEVALAKKCLVVCGHETTSWEALVAAARNINPTRHVKGSFYTLSPSLKTFSTRIAARAMYKNYIDRNMIETSSLTWSILSKCRREEATDPRDKVFGLFSILGGLGFTFPVPDYTKTMVTVYEDLAVGYIQQYKQLGILELTHTFGRHPKLPTWVPDFSDHKSFIGVDPTKTPPKKLVDPTLLIGRSPERLPLRGKNIAQIESRLQESHFTYEELLKFRQLRNKGLNRNTGLNRYSLLVPWASSLRGWASLLNQAHLSAEKDAAHVFSWLLKRERYETSAGNGSFVTVSRQVLEILADSETKTIPPGELDNPEYEGLPNTSDGAFLYLIYHTPQANQMTTRKWLSDAYENVCEHTLVILSTGHIGRVPYSIEEKDIVVWFAGAHRPMIIRPVGENYTLIGPAYIYELEESDVWEEQDDVTQLEIFTLQ